MASIESVPLELNWVQKRAACSANQIFAQLQNGIDEDVSAINSAKNLPPDRQFKAETLLTGDTVVVIQLGGYDIPQRVKIGICGDQICAEDSTVRKSWRASIGLNHAGRCILRLENGEPVEQWQFRKMVLQRLFFGDEAEI